MKKLLFILTLFPSILLAQKGLHISLIGDYGKISLVNTEDKAADNLLDYVNSTVPDVNLGYGSGSYTTMHEYGHYLQSQHSGPLYLYKYGFPSLFTDTRLGFNNGTGFSHDDFWVEQDANTRGFEHFQYRSGFDDWNPRFRRGRLRNVQWYEPLLFPFNPLLIIRFNRNN